MNEGTVKATNNTDQQARKGKLQKVRVLVMVLFIVGCGLWALSATLGVSHPVAIFIMTTGGLCCGISVALSIRTTLPMIQMQQRKEVPSKKQLQKNQPKIQWLAIAVIFLFTALFFMASLVIFH